MNRVKWVVVAGLASGVFAVMTFYGLSVVDAYRSPRVRVVSGPPAQPGFRQGPGGFGGGFGFGGGVQQDVQLVVRFDKDGDGRFETVKTFVDGLNMATSVPPAPARLSITNCWPSRWPSFWPNTRAKTSVEPPAANGTITRTGFSG